MGQEQRDIHGVLIIDVQKDGAAAKAGLHPTRRGEEGNILWGDIIVGIDKHKIHSANELFSFLADNYKVGQQVTVRAHPAREGEIQDVQVTLSVEKAASCVKQHGRKTPMLLFTCSTCGKRVQAEDAFAGKNVLCPVCNIAMTAPTPPHSGESPTSAVATPEHAAQAKIAMPPRTAGRRRDSAKGNRLRRCPTRCHRYGKRFRVSLHARAVSDTTQHRNFFFGLLGVSRKKGE